MKKVIRFSWILPVFGVLFTLSCEKEPDDIPISQAKYISKELSVFSVKLDDDSPVSDSLYVKKLELLELYLDTLLNYIPYEDLNIISDKSIYLRYPPSDFIIKYWQPGNSDDVDDKRKIGSIEIGDIDKLLCCMAYPEPGILIKNVANQYYESLGPAQKDNIKEAFENALVLNKYTSVRQLTSEGLIEKSVSPASLNPREYFCVISEAYFNMSDYYPFNYEDLKDYDPEGFSVLTSVWGIRKIKDFTKVSSYGFDIMYRKSEENNEEVVLAVNKAFSALKTMSDSLDSDILSALRARPIWIELNNGTGACFHPNKMWILQNNHVPEKAHCVELTNATNFNKWTGVNQPLIVWHELSHYYHYHVAGWNNTVITNAYNNALSSGLHRNVEHINGDGSVRIVNEAYALTNEKEYFAECSEAYWGKNDFYPYTRKELQEYDTAGFNMVVKLWKVK